METFEDILNSAQPFVDFLQRDSFFNLAYQPSSEIDALIIADAKVGIRYGIESSSDKFRHWETVTSYGVFTDDFKWHRIIDFRLSKTNYFDLKSKNFNGADQKWSTSVSCPLVELMLRDVGIILNCCANEYFPPLWKNILDIYLANGFPCGWKGQYPNGKIVVFSNF